MKHRTIALICASGALAMGQVATAAPRPDAKLWNGTWQLNSEKSKFSSAEYTTKKDVRTYTVTGNRLTMHSDLINGAGQAIKWGYSATLNGKWFRATGNPNADQVALTLISPRELRSETRLKGKPSAKATVSVSADGKEITVKRSLATPKGDTDDTMIYERTK
ncbi:MAG TPA: hypothetical protein VF750_05460 [Sphingomicrobium sp.]